MYRSIASAIAAVGPVVSHQKILIVVAHAGRELKTAVRSANKVRLG